MLQKTFFSLSLGSVIIVRQAKIIFLVLKSIRIAVSLRGTFTHIQKPLCLQGCCDT